MGIHKKTRSHKAYEVMGGIKPWDIIEKFYVGSRQEFHIRISVRDRFSKDDYIKVRINCITGLVNDGGITSRGRIYKAEKNMLKSLYKFIENNGPKYISDILPPHIFEKKKLSEATIYSAKFKAKGNLYNFLYNFAEKINDIQKNHKS